MNWVLEYIDDVLTSHKRANSVCLDMLDEMSYELRVIPKPDKIDIDWYGGDISMVWNVPMITMNLYKGFEQPSVVFGSHPKLFETIHIRYKDIPEKIESVVTILKEHFSL